MGSIWHCTVLLPLTAGSTLVLTAHLDKIPAWCPDIPEMSTPDQCLTTVKQGTGPGGCEVLPAQQRYQEIHVDSDSDQLGQSIAEQNCALPDLGVDQRQVHPAVPEQLPGAQW